MRKTRRIAMFIAGGLGAMATLVGCGSAYDKPGFVTATSDDAIFVVRESDAQHVEHLKAEGEIEKPITAIGADIDGRKVMAPNEQTLYDYLGWE